jgi:acetyl-CoA carboxylase carboxyl transferase subunit beta
MIFHRELVAALNVCSGCGFHMPLSAKERVRTLFDNGEYQLLPVPSVPQDPLQFRDLKRYADRQKDARTKSKLSEAVLIAEGCIQGSPLIAVIFDFAFIGGSMGLAVGEALVAGAERALNRKVPYLTVTASGGARMQEGILSLMQMPRSIAAISLLKESGIPYISLLTNPTMGGVSASFASLGDVNLAEPGALIGFTGARVIQETLRSPLPEGFQTAEFQLDHGAIDQVVHRKQLSHVLGNILAILGHKLYKKA